MSEGQFRTRELLSSLYRRQAAVVIALLLIALTGYQAQDWIIGHLSEDGTLINVAGRQRMLSQRSVAFSLQMAMASSPDERTLFAELLGKAGAEMAAGHANLIAESHRRGMSPELESLYFGGTPSLDREVKAFVADVSQLSLSHGQEIPISRLRALADKARLSVLPGLERVVIQYQEESRNHVARLRDRFTMGLGILVGVLIFSWAGVFSPMARRLRQEFAAHREAVERTELILNSVGEGIIGIDRDGRASFANRSALTMLGYQAWELLGNQIHPLVHHTRHDGSAYPAEDCPLFHTLTEGDGCSIMGELFWRHDGTSFPVHYASTAILKDGALIGAVVSFRDISEEIATESALAASEQIKTSILDAALDAIITIDRQGRVVEFNPAAERIFGCQATQAVGREVAELIIPEASREAHRQGLERMAKGHQSTVLGRRLEMTGLHSSGHEIPVELTITHLPDHGLFTAFIRDLSEQKQTEAALRRSQKMEAVGQLTGGIAHDFNNLLGIITGNLELLERTVDGNEVGERRVATALRSARRGADLTRRLLSFSRQDKAAQGKARTDVNEVVGGMLEMLERSLTRRIEIRTRLHTDLWAVDINRSEFEDYLLNLALNARDAMPDGGNLIIETSNQVIAPEYRRIDPNLEPGHYVVVSMSDTGTGIPKEVVDRIFEPFFTTKERGKGTGLGLAMAYGFAKRSGGHIRVYSEAGMGTTFRLYLPLPPEGEAETRIKEEEGQDVPTGTETIVVVDDEASLAEIAGEFLTELGYHAIVCTDAARALDILRERSDVALLFTDVVMPHGLDGVALERRVRELGLTCKVLFTSGFSGFSEHGGVVDTARLLPKPYGKADLARRVRQILDERRMP
ncbi:MAG: PAS domain S-box protein [Magnetospirillum sp.]|nr:PAS domain S-box protein [Magnetospirillum sp.]